MLKVFTVRRVESVCIEDTLIFEVNLVEDNGMLDDDDGVDKRARTPRPLPGSIRSTRSIGRGDRKCEEVEKSAKKSKLCRIIQLNYLCFFSYIRINDKNQR